MEENSLKAKEVFILLKKEYRISRNIRAEWYLKKIGTYIIISRKLNVKDYHGELDVVSILPQNPPNEWDSDTAHEYKYLVTEETQLHFLAQKYRLVFCIDLSPSLTIVNLDGGKIAFDEIFPTLEKCLRGIVKPFYVPGSQLLLFPKIYVTIIAHTPFFKSQPHQVIVQGWLLMNEKENLQSFLKNIRIKLTNLQNQLAELTSETYKQIDTLREKMIGSTHNDDADWSRMIVTHPMVTPDTGFVNMIRYGIVAIQLLPQNSLAGIVVITDGVISLPEATMFDALLVQLRNHTVSCSFMQVGSSYQLDSSLGYVPFNDLMSFLANATCGVYMKNLPVIDENFENGINEFHKALLIWRFQKMCDNDADSKFAQISSFKNLPISNNCYSLVKKQEWQSVLSANLTAVLSCRLREGYTIKKVQNSSKNLLVVLVLPWKYNISIEYCIISSWPHGKVETEVWIEATYEFLNDVTSKDLHNEARSPYRQKMVSKYWQTLKELKETDILLESLQSFPHCPLYFTVPDCVQRGNPVFYYSPQMNVPEAGGDFSVQFANFWKPVSILNVDKWQKWFHTHRMGVILKHETPLPKNLHVANANGRFSVVQSRRSEQSLTSFLREWTNFTLIENVAYIKFLYKKDDDAEPCSFFVVRITSRRLPYLTMHLAFLGGTSGHTRNEILKDLKGKLTDLKVKVRDRSRDRRSAVNFSQRNFEEKNSSTGSFNVDVATVPCCTITHKPIDRILIWYDRKPSDFFSERIRNKSSNTNLVNQSASNSKALLSRYLYHKRWIWEVTSSNSLQSRILNTLNRMRIHDGFKFAYSCDGMVTLVKELRMKLEIQQNDNFFSQNFDECDFASHCVVQYTMFPPHLVNSSESSEDETVEIENFYGETHLSTECWVEPQNGVVHEDLDCPWQGLNYKQLPETFFAADQECIWGLMSFDYLVQFCQKGTSAPFEGGTKQPIVQESLEFIPYSLRLTSLLSRCLRAEILLSTFFQDCFHILTNSASIVDESDRCNHILYSLLLEHLNRLHDGKQFFLSDIDNENLPGAFASRAHDQQHPSPFSDRSSDNEIAKWRCFVKFSTQHHFLITLVPATYRDLKLLLLNKSAILDPKPTVFHLVSDVTDLDDVANAWNGDNNPSNTATTSPKLHHHSNNNKSHSALHRRNSVSSRQLRGPSSVDYKRTRYKSGPAYSNKNLVGGTEEAAVEENVEPSSRERACSLQNTQAKKLKYCSSKTEESSSLTSGAGLESIAPSTRDAPPLVAGLESNAPPPGVGLGSIRPPGAIPPPKERTETIPAPVEVEEKIRKRNISMPAKAHLELSSHHRTMSNKSMSVEQMKGDAMFSTMSTNLRNNSEETVHDDDMRATHVPIYGSTVLPIYVFDCRLNAIINQFINRSDRETVLGKDLYINSLFKIHDELEVSPATTAQEKQSSPEPTSEESDISGDLKSLRTLVETIEKCQRRSFVMAAFRCLSRNLFIHELNVQAALDQCQEILLETDIAAYLRIVCGHLKDFHYKLGRDIEDSAKDSMLQINFPLNLLSYHHPSSELIAIHGTIQRRFFNILRKRFKTVPNLPDFYYYSPEYDAQTDLMKTKYWSMSQRTRKKSEASNFSEGARELDDDESIEFVSSEHGSVERKLSSQMSDLDDATTRISMTSDEGGSGDSPATPPLFLHFTCTVRSHGNRVISTTSVKNLPTCLGDISSCFDGPDVDTSKLSISLDILVMTLTGGATIAADSLVDEGSVNAMRTISFCSTGSSIPQRNSESNNSTSDNSEEFFPESEKMLIGLPSDQYIAITTTFNEIKWLIDDEIVSSKLHCYPVTDATLDLVCSHVSNVDSRKARNCLLESVPLNFVFGIDQSLQSFLEGFLSLKVNGFHLEKQGNLYFLVQDESGSSSRKRHHSSLIPSLNISSIIARHQTQSEISAQKSNLSPMMDGSDLPKSPTKKLQPKVSFETDVCTREEESRTKKKIFSSEINEKEKWIKRRQRKERRDSEKRGLAESSDSECEISSPQVVISDLTREEMPEDRLHPSDSTKEFETAEVESSSELNKEKLNSGGETFTETGSVKRRHDSGDVRQSRHSSGTGSITRQQSDVSSALESVGGHTTEDGCEGDISNSDDCSDWLQEYRDSDYYSLPEFWLVLEITRKNINVYFHHRENWMGESSEYQEIHLQVVDRLNERVKLVNQKLLLKNLHDTRLCNNLLEPGTNEDASDDFDHIKDGEIENNDCLQSTVRFQAGALTCNQVWSKMFYLHPRLKSGMGCKGNMGIQALQASLNPFSVSNRKNMFVYEDSSGTVPNVFYLRLHELQSGGREETGLSRSSSIVSLSKRKEDESLLQQEGSPVARPRIGSFIEKENVNEAIQKKNQDFVALTVYGIAEPGASIKEKLVSMLQNRLDDTVLDSICLMLWSHRRAKFTPEDVHFIQPPCQSPTKVLRYGINCQFLDDSDVLSFYLRQNMQDSGFSKPKYPDSKPENYFQDFSAGQNQESNIFLFVCSQKSAAKGVACIAYSIVDSAGNALQPKNSARSSPRIFDGTSSVCQFQTFTNSSMLKKDVLKKVDTLNRVDVIVYEDNVKKVDVEDFSKKENTFKEEDTLEEDLVGRDEQERNLNSDCINSAVFEFKIWESGQLEGEELERGLKEAIEHALWDYAMESRFLVAPLVTATNFTPAAQLSSSIGGSPLFRQLSSPKNEKSSSLSSAQVDTGKLAKSPLQTRHSVDLGKECTSILPRVEGRFTVEETLMDRTNRLHCLYSNSIIPWIEYGIGLNVPTTRTFSIDCPTKSALPTFIGQIQRWISVQFGEGNNKIFQRLHDELVAIDHSEVEQLVKRNEESVDLILTNRNEKKWIAAVQGFAIDDAPTRGDKNMRFESLVVKTDPSSSPSSNFGLSTFGTSIIPRQTFFIATVKEQKVTVYTYNWIKELNEMLLTHLNRMRHWTIARNRLLSSLAFQKMGLFHHQPFVRKENEFFRKEIDKKEENNPYVGNLHHIEGLIKYAALGKDSTGPTERSGRRGQVQQNFCEVLRDSPPAKTLQESIHRNAKDKLYAHGMQMADTSRIANIKDKEKRILLSQKQNSSEFTEQILTVFKKHSRINHFCLTPLLFFPSWRYQIASARDHSLDGISSSHTSKFRHESSGKSQHSERRSSIAGGMTGASSIRRVGGSHCCSSTTDTKWHDALCLNYLKEFIQYLHCLGFSTMMVTSTNATSQKGKQTTRSSSSKNPGETLKTPTYLVKNLFGGTVILQINFLEPYFNTTVYILESTRVQFRKFQIAYEIPSSFIDEIERIKIVLHMHSFTYDYHLRAVGIYVANKQLLFAQGYHLSSFLSDFIKYYNKGPNFARNLIYSDDIRIDDTGMPAEQLYNYILAREKDYNMSVLRMTSNVTDKSNEMFTEFILVHTKSYEDDSIDYEVTILVSHDTSHDLNAFSLHLKFYVILTSRRDMYPNNLPERRTGRLRTVSSTLVYEQLKSPAKTGMSESRTSFTSGNSSVSSLSSTNSLQRENLLKQSPFSIRSEPVNYLGYFSEYEEYMQNILSKQVDDGRIRIHNIFNTAKIHCRRDSLWQRLIGCLMEERKASKEQQPNTNLNFGEFCELLDLISSTNIEVFDKNLCHFSSQPIQWYQSLAKNVLTKYHERTRTLASPDGTIYHVVVLNAKCAETCMMLSVNLQTQQGNVQLIRKKLKKDDYDRHLDETTRVFFEDFVNCCCFYLWACLV